MWRAGAHPARHMLVAGGTLVAIKETADQLSRYTALR